MKRQLIKCIVVLFCINFGNISLSYAKCIGVKTPTSQKSYYWCYPNDCQLILRELKYNNDYIIKEKWDANDASLNEILNICQSLQDSKQSKIKREEMYQMGKSLNEKAKNLKDSILNDSGVVPFFKGLFGK